MRFVIEGRRAGWQRALVTMAVAATAAAPLAAQSAPVQGRVRDDAGAAVYGASVALYAGPDSASADARPLRSATTDALGVFRLDPVPDGRYRLRVAVIGFGLHDEAVTVAGERRIDLDVRLARSAVALEGITVDLGRGRERVSFEREAGATVRTVTREELIRIPGLAEPDPLRAVEVLPGVVSTSDLSSAFHVRGGSADQNLIMLDGVPLLSPFHLGGFFSVFNADMLRGAELQSGGFSAQHGGRVSSVLQIESDAGDGDFRADAGISLLASRVALAGGLGPAAGALGLREGRWRASVRRSYLDLLMRPFFHFPYHLTDVQGVFEGWTEGGDRVSISGYSGRDRLDLGKLDPETFPLRIGWGWGNDALGGRWTRAREGGGTLELSAGATRFGSDLGFPDFADIRFQTAIDQLYGRADLSGRPSNGWRLQSGVSADRLSFDNLAEAGGTVFGQGDGRGWLIGSYGLAEWTRPSAWIVEAGARVDVWSPDPGDVKVEVAPRFAAKRFFLGGRMAVKGALGRYTQFVHSLRDEELPIGLDVWVVSGESAPALRSNQLQGAVEAYLWSDWFVSAEAYMRTFDGVVAFNPAEDPNDTRDDLLSGRGRSRGVDLLVRKDGGSWGGWLALSWLRARRTFPDFLAPPTPDGTLAEVEYPPVFDRRVDLDVVVRLPLPFQWEGGARWNLATGTPYTRPLGTYAYFRPRFADRGGRFSWNQDEGDFGRWAVALGGRNADRYPTYHRLDVSARRTFEKSWGRITPHVDVLNVYNRRNVLLYYYEYQHDPPRRWGISMFPAIPTVGVEVSFR
jgi:hypothetical protein